MKLKPFTDKATCPKCDTAWEGTGITYCDGRDCIILKPTQDPDRIVSLPRYPPEHLHCTCEECGYEWLMECADAVEEIKDELNPAPTVIDVCCPGCYASISYWLHDGEPNLKQWSMHTEQQP